MAIIFCTDNFIGQVADTVEDYQDIFIKKFEIFRKKFLKDYEIYKENYDDINTNEKIKILTVSDTEKAILILEIINITGF